MDLPTLPTNATFFRSLGMLADYMRPVADMWSSFWLKAAAAHDGEKWRLCYFALVGRWSEATTAEPVWEPGDSLVAVSKRLDATEAWALLDRLITDGTVELSPSVIARAPDVSMGQIDVWQKPTPVPIGHTIADVVEPAHWRWLYAYNWSEWLADWQAKESLRLRITPDLERFGMIDFRSFINTYFGSGEQRPSDFNAEIFQFLLDLPLALQVSPGIPDSSSHTRPLMITLRAPLAMDDLIVTSGNRPAATRAQAPLTDVLATQDGWTVGTATIPSGDGKIWLENPLLYRRLLYEIPLLTPAAQAAEALAYIYGPTTHSKNPKKGAQTWTKDLLEGKGHQFELALVNALSRFGIPVLFSGQIQEQSLSSQSEASQFLATANVAPQPKASGPATPGFDLIALDQTQRRAVFISAKGITHSPGDDDIENLVKGVASVGRILEGWYVTGLIVCHASATRLVRVRERRDIVVWGQDELQALLNADTPDPVKRLLWISPARQQLDVFRGYIR